MRVTGIPNWVSFILVIVGALNWGLVGLLNVNLVAAIFGDGTFLSRLIYILVGLGAIYLLYDVYVKKTVI